MKNKARTRFPTVIIACVLIFIVIYNFAFLFPFTNNAFVVANVRPVAANVQGYVTDIYVQNEQEVKKGQPLFTVFKTPYELAYQKASSDVAQAKAQLQVFKKQTEKTKYLLQAQKERLEKLQFDYEHNHSAMIEHAISKQTVNTLLKDKNAALNKLRALEKELEINRQQIIVQEKKYTLWSQS